MRSERSPLPTSERRASVSSAFCFSSCVSSSLADNSDSIRYLSTKPTLLEKGKVQAELVATAMQTIKEKAAMYQQELDATLVPVEVTELAQNFIAANPNYSAMRKSLSSSGDRGVFDSKELSVEVTVKYQLRPNK